MMKRAGSALCWIMVVVFPAALIAADINSAMLSSTGVVKINGTLAPRSTALHAGDRVATEQNGSVMLTSNGTQIALPSNSSAVYGGDNIAIGHGRVLVRTRTGMQGRVGSVTVTPVNSTAKFQMTESQGTVAIAALDGAVNVSDGAHSMVLPAGQVMVNAANGQEPAPPEPASTKSTKMPGWVVGTIVVGAVGGLVGGLAAAGTFSSESSTRK